MRPCTRIDRRQHRSGGARGPRRPGRPRVLRAVAGAAVAVAVGCGGAAAGPVAAEAVTASATAGPVSVTASPSMSFTDQEAADAAAYWTADRIRAAQPVDGGDAAAPAAPVADAELVHSATGHLPAQSWIGILTFTRAGRDASCTASAIRSGSGLVVATAGHCLVRDRQYATRVAFTPGWDGADRPFGVWGADEYQVPASWASGEEVAHDAGFVRMRRHPSGPLLADAVAAVTPSFGLATPGLHFLSLGYPGSPTTYQRKPLTTCVGPAYRTSEGQLAFIGCEAIGGMSGGPVVHLSTSAPRGTQAGVISASYDGLHGVGTAVTGWTDVERRVLDAVDSFD